MDTKIRLAKMKRALRTVGRENRAWVLKQIELLTGEDRKIEWDARMSRDLPTVNTSERRDYA